MVELCILTVVEKTMNPTAEIKNDRTPLQTQRSLLYTVPRNEYAGKLQHNTTPSVNIRTAWVFKLIHKRP